MAEPSSYQQGNHQQLESLKVNNLLQSFNTTGRNGAMISLLTPGNLLIYFILFFFCSARFVQISMFKKIIF